jgi:hypothetical protein
MKKFFEVFEVGLGFRVGRLEIYRSKWAPTITFWEKVKEIGIVNGGCGCVIVELVLFGFTWLGPNWKCEGGMDALD